MIPRSKIAPFFLLALLVLAAIASFQILKVFLDYVLIAIFLGYLTYPMYKFFAKKIKSHALAAGASVAAVTLGFLTPAMFLFFELAKELAGIVVGFDSTQFYAQIDAAAISLVNALPFLEGASAQLAVRQIADIAVPNGLGYLSSLVTSLISGLPSLFIGSFVLLYVLYYIYLDGDQLLVMVRELLPLQEGHRDLLLREMGRVIEGVVYGHVVTSLIQAILAAIGFWLFGVPGVVLWSVVMFVLALLPLVGPPIVWGPWAIYLMFNGRVGAGIGLAIYGATLISGLDNFIRPKIISGRANVHPAIVLLGVLGGVVLFGFSGIILGPLILSLFVSILGVYRREFLRENARLNQF